MDSERCETCGKNFSSVELKPSVLRQRIKAHKKRCKTEEEDFTCNVCSRDYGQQNITQNLMRKRLKVHQLSNSPRTSKIEPKIAHTLSFHESRTRSSELNTELVASDVSNLLRAVGDSQDAWRNIFLMGGKEHIKKKCSAVIVQDRGLPKLILKPPCSKITRFVLAETYPNVLFTETKGFLGVTKQWVYKIGVSYLEDFNIYSVKRDVMSMYEDVSYTMLSLYPGLEKKDFCWTFSTILSEQTLLRVHYFHLNIFDYD